MKKIKYILLGLKLFRLIKNWYVIPLIILGQKRIVKLQSGINLLVNDYLNLIAILEIYYFSDYEFKLKKPPKTVLDIGANIGDSSIYYSNKYPGAQILAFEPDSGLFRVLKKNIQLNQLTRRISPKNSAVGSKNTKITFYKNKFSGLSGIVKNSRSTKKVVVRSVSLKKVVGSLNNSCDLAKIDCEGGEFDILLRSEPKTLKMVKNYIIEYHDSLTSHNHNELVKLLKSLNYKVKVKPHNIEDDIGIIYAFS